MNEADLMRTLQASASNMGARLFRQNTGMAWTGNTVIRVAGIHRLNAGDVLIRNARTFHAGFSGMSDLGGWVPMTIAPDMIGATVAVYTQVEVKTEDGKPTPEQERWIGAVNKAGGRAGVARSEGDLRAIFFARG